MGAHWTDSFFEGSWDEVIRNVYTPEESRDEALFICKALGLRRGSRVLDVPCGDGRISLELASLGCSVIGVDQAAPSIRRARRRAGAAGLDAGFQVGDMRRIGSLGPVHAVVNWWGSFGYFEDAENLALLRGFAEALSADGSVLVDQINRERVLRNFRSAAWDEYGPVRVHVRNTWDASTQRIEGTWTMVHGEKRTRRKTSMRIYTPRQMERLMEQAGLSLEALYGWIDGSPYSRGSKRMIAVARRA